MASSIEIRKRADPDTSNLHQRDSEAAEAECRRDTLAMLRNWVTENRLW